MKRQTIILVAAISVGAFILGMAIETRSQASVSLQKLAEENAKITRMDWILLNTRVHVLEEMLKDDLSATFSPTSYSFDRNTGKIRIAVYVDSSWQGKRLDEATKAFTQRGTSLCVAPSLSQHGELLSLTMAPGGPSGYCSTTFFTLLLAKNGKDIEKKDLAVFENGKLSMR